MIGGEERWVPFLAVDLQHSDACFAKAFPAEPAEAFCDGHNTAFAFIGGVPRCILYDGQGFTASCIRWAASSRGRSCGNISAESCFVASSAPRAAAS